MPTPTRATTTLLASGAVAAVAAAETSADSIPVADFLARIRSPDEAVNHSAWQDAEKTGSAAVAPLAEALAEANFELARRAKRALYRIVRHAGRPGADEEARAVETQLIRVLQHSQTVVRREALWMLSEIAGDRAVPPMAALLNHPETAEDARCALMRIPGRKATAALKSAMASAPEPSKYALAHSLRQRGVKVSGFPTQKLLPRAQTTVLPIQPKAK